LSQETIAMANSARTRIRLTSTHKTWLFLALAFAFAVAAPSHQAAAQQQSINGSLRGTITDPSGAPIAGVTVTVKNLDTGFTRQVVTAGDGVYVAANLPIGTYSVATAATGFAPFSQSGVHLDAGTDATLDQQLKLGGVATELQVTADAPIVETARFDLGRTISADETENLPLTSRNPYNFILFQPGVSGHPNTENGIPNTLNTNGLVDRVNYQLDGEVDTETDRYGLRLFAISDSYVQEVQTISNSFAPEFGDTAGIIYNVITGSGTNHLHGEAQYIWRPKVAASCPVLSDCNPNDVGGIVKPSIHVDDILGRLSGPVIKDKLFVYGAYEHLKRATPAAVSPGAALTLAAAGDPAADIQTAPQVQRAQWMDVRVDYTINQKNQAFVRYNYFRNNYPFNTAAGGSNGLSAASDFQDRAHDLGAQLLTTFTPRLLNEFRASWPYRNEHHVADPLTGPGPSITIAAQAYNGVNYAAATFGGPGPGTVGDKFQEKIPSFNDNVTLIKGPHAFKFGAGFQKNNDDQLADIYTQYAFTGLTQYFAILAAQKAGAACAGGYPTCLQAYKSVAASIGVPGAQYHSVFFDFFAQDTWQLSKSVLVSYGVRYDQYRAPTPPAGEPLTLTQSFRTPKGNFAPRVGLAYSPFQGTVIRVNSGIFYEQTPTNTWYNPLYNNAAAGTGSFTTSINGGTTCAPIFPGSPQTVTATCLPQQSAYELTPNFKNEYTWNANLQVSQQLAKNDALTLSYVMTSGRNMQYLTNANLKQDATGATTASFLADGRPVYNGTANVNDRVIYQLANGVVLNNITLINTGSTSSYNGLSATYQHRMSAGLTTSASYTWSHAITGTPEGTSYQFSSNVEDSSAPFRDRGDSNINRPNAFTFSTVYNPKSHLDNKIVNAFANGNELAVLGNFLTGDPLNETSSNSLNGDSLASSRPLFVQRNTLRSPPVYQVDARFTRTLYNYHERIKTKLIVESTNVFNRSNFITESTTATTQACIASAAGVTPVNLCTNALTPGSSGFLAGAVTAAPTFSHTGGLDARILQFGLKIDF
jgi:hypothetical protein